MAQEVVAQTSRGEADDGRPFVGLSKAVGDLKLHAGIAAPDGAGRPTRSICRSSAPVRSMPSWQRTSPGTRLVGPGVQDAVEDRSLPRTGQAYRHDRPIVEELAPEARGGRGSDDRHVSLSHSPIAPRAEDACLASGDGREDDLGRIVAQRLDDRRSSLSRSLSLATTRFPIGAPRDVLTRGTGRVPRAGKLDAVLVELVTCP